MERYILNYWFEHGGTCLWSVNRLADDKFGYAIDNHELPISKALVDELNTLETEYHGYLNWDDPASPSPWTLRQKQDFIDRSNAVYLKLLLELGEEFEIINDVERCVVEE
jgi:hypothetical protein